MSRSDVEELIDIINQELPNVDKHAFTQPVGGYRRGKEQNGDLDIVIASQKLEHTTDHLLKRIVEHMIEKGIQLLLSNLETFLIFVCYKGMSSMCY